MSSGLTAPAAPATSAVPVPEQPSILTRTKMCKFFSQGRCKKGASCTYAHSRDALRPMPDLSCTKLCPKRAACDDPKCKFAHRRADLRSTDEVARRAAATMRMPLCLEDLCPAEPQPASQAVELANLPPPMYLASAVLPLKPVGEASASPTAAGSRSRSNSVASTGSTDGSSLDDHEDDDSDASPQCAAAAHEVRRLARLLPKVEAKRHVHNTFVDFEDSMAEHVQRVQICGDLYTCRPHGRFSEIRSIL